MNQEFDEMIQLFSSDEAHRLLKGGNFGLELESQRVTADGNLALTPHPSVFGSKTGNPRITTDFSESQIEMVTPVNQSVEEVYASLEAIRNEVDTGIGDELLWPLSMPPVLPGEELIPIARYDETEEGKEREAYRKALATRYGKKMQMISGIHFNFSFSEAFIDFLHDETGSIRSRRDFTDEMYFALTRNFLRYRWLLIYLFGASPDCDPTYYPVIRKELSMVRRCCPFCRSRLKDYTRYATSLRVSRFGYANEVQGKHDIRFDNLEEYIRKINKMMIANVLQKESEFYSPIRLKQSTKKDETQLSALTTRGVEYAEVRILDLNPYERLGISLQQLRFMQVFMLYCLMEQSKKITSPELGKINTNHHLTALFGRSKELYLQDYSGGIVLLKTAGGRIFKKLKRIAELMDLETGDNRYLHCVETEQRKLDESALLPSVRISNDIKERKGSFKEFGISRAMRNSRKHWECKQAYNNEIKAEIKRKEGVIDYGYTGLHRI